MISFKQFVNESVIDLSKYKGPSAQDKLNSRKIATARRIRDYIDKDIRTYLNLTGEPLSDLPDDLKTVWGDLVLENSAIESLPENLHVRGNLILTFAKKIRELPKGLKIDGYLLASKSGLVTLPDDIQVQSDIVLDDCMQLQSLPQGIKINGPLNIEGSSISELPDNLTVKGNLYATYCSKLTRMPENLTLLVGDPSYNRAHVISFEATNIQNLSSTIKIQGDLLLNATPVGKRYTSEQAKQLCPGVQGEIITDRR